MAYDFLGLTNLLLQRVNEVELSSSNFSSTTGFNSSAKQYINNSINFINRRQHMWPWNYVSYDETLTAGQSRYSYQSDTKVVDFDTFRIQQDDTFGNDTQWLKPVNYDEYVRRYIDAEYETDTSIRDIPYLVFKAKNREYGVYPPPKEAYTLTFEYFSSPAKLSAATDVPTIPEAFEDIIVDGGEYYTNYFRGDLEAANLMYRKWTDDIDSMRRIYIPFEDDLVDTRIIRSKSSTYSTLDLN